MEDVTRQTFIDAPPDEVWDAITEPEQLSEWFGADVEGEIAEGQLVHFVSPDGSGRRAVIERVDPERRLTFRYLETQGDPSSRVDITIDPVQDGSFVRINERRIEPAVSHTQRIGFQATSLVSV